jgi:plastocyanin
MRRVARLAAGLAACGVVGGAAREASAQPARVTVYAFDFDFSVNLPGAPVQDAVINVGDIIQWVPLDDFHNTVAAEGQAEFWASEILGMADTFEWVFDTPGVFHYYCQPHGQDNGDGTASGMAGTITVVPGPGAGVVVGAAGLVAAGRRRRRWPGDRRLRKQMRSNRLMLLWARHGLRSQEDAPMFDFLWNLHQQQRIGDLAKEVASGDRSGQRAEREVRRLEDRIETMHLVMMSMWAIMQQKLGVTDQDLAEMVRELDLRDGKIDGKMSPRVAKCSACGRTMSERHARCLYCGENKLDLSMFEKP